jgi:hypothetical protein
VRTTIDGPLKLIVEAGSALVVLLGLVFVGLELRDNARAARASAYQELGVAVTGLWVSRATNRELSDALKAADDAALSHDAAVWDGLEASDQEIVRAYILANLRLYETVYLQVEEQLLTEDAMSALGWTRLEGWPILHKMWPNIRGSVTPRFALYLESKVPALTLR